MIRSLQIRLMTILCLGFGALNAQVTTFDYTGSPETYTVPPGVYSIGIECYGAEGEIGLGLVGGDGGLGGYAQGVMAVTPGDILNVFVGGQDGYNGGGAGGNIGAGNGGGASDVRFGGVTLADRVIVAGGGGGGGATGCAADWDGGDGGAGGGLAGGNGVDSPNGGGGFGGTSGTGGAEGIGCPSFLGLPGSDDGTGGDGQGCCCATTPGGGGGGGGYVVGGGGGGGSAGTVGCADNDKGGGGGGAGGTSYTGTLTDAITDDGVGADDGSVIITVLCTPLTVTVTDDEICLGDSFTLDAEGAGDVTWDGGVIDGESFTPDAAGTITYTATSDDVSDCSVSIDIIVHDALEIDYTAIEEVDGGDGEIAITITGGVPPYTYDWDIDGTGDFDDDEDLTDLMNGTYILEVMCQAGCLVNETITLGSGIGIQELNGLDVNVFPNPATNAITVTYGGAFNYELTSTKGDVNYTGTGSGQKLIDMTQLESGVYFIQITAENKSTTIQIVKQ